MGLRGINYIYSGVLNLDTGNMPVYYDFDTTSGTKYNSVNFASFFIGEDKNIISDNNASIIGNTSSFTGNGSSGNFSYGYLSLDNKNDLFSSNFAIFASQEKCYTGDAALFSCLKGDTVKSGYCFGINSANKMYFQYFDNQKQKYNIQTSLLQLSDKNLINFRKVSNSLYFSIYDNGSKTFKTEVKSVDSESILPSNEFLIGSGENQKNYSGYIDEFLYLTENISNLDANMLASGFWSDTKSGNAFLIQSGVTGGISGYNYQQTGLTGILSTNNVLTGTGYTTGYIDIYQYIPETGVISPGETKIEFLENLPTYCTSQDEIPIYREVTTLDTTGVIGLLRQFSGTDDVIEGQDIYQTVYVTGFISSGLFQIPIYNTGKTDVSGFSNILSGDRQRLSEYGMSDIIYLKKYFDQSFGQEQSGINNFDSLALYEKEDDYSNEFKSFDFLNKTALRSLNGLGFKIDQKYDGSEFSIFSNGLFKFSNSEIGSAGDDNFYKSGSIQESIILLSGNNSGAKIFYDAEDFAIKQVFSGTNSISVHNNIFFKNGYKLISGIDYTGNAVDNSFTPIKSSDLQKEILAIEFRTQSGQSQSIVEPSLGKFFRGSSTNYFGRLRVGEDFLLEISKCSDLLSNKSQLVPSGIKPLFSNKEYENILSTGLIEGSYITGASGFFSL